MLAERMVKHFIFGITGPRTGKWTKVQGNFGNDVRLMSTRAMEDPGLASGTWLSVATSFVLSLAPNIVFNYFRDYRHRKEVCTKLFHHLIFIQFINCTKVLVAI